MKEKAWRVAMATTGNRPPHHASVRSDQSHQRARLWAPGHGQCITKYMGWIWVRYERNRVMYGGYGCGRRAIRGKGFHGILEDLRQGVASSIINGSDLTRNEVFKH